MEMILLVFVGGWFMVMMVGLSFEGGVLDLVGRDGFFEHVSGLGCWDGRWV